MTCTLLLGLVASKYCLGQMDNTLHDVKGICLTQEEATQQTECLQSGAYSSKQTFAQSDAQVDYYLPCGIIPQNWTKGSGATDEEQSCSFWPCPSGTFSLTGYTMDEYCFGEYLDSESTPEHPPGGRAGPLLCAPIDACHKKLTMIITKRSNASDASHLNPDDFFVFVHDCFAVDNTYMKGVGFHHTPYGCANFSRYSRPADDGPRDTNSNAEELKIAIGLSTAVAFVIVPCLALALLLWYLRNNPDKCMSLQKRWSHWHERITGEKRNFAEQMVVLNHPESIEDGADVNSNTASAAAAGGGRGGRSGRGGSVGYAIDDADDDDDERI